jgi:hypothetical protein
MPEENKEDYFEAWVRDILAELNKATRQWLSVGDMLNKAVLEGAHLKRLCSKVGISYPTGTKLLKIAACPRLKMYADQLASIDSWSTLYELHLMSDADFATYRDKKLIAGQITTSTRAEVSKLRTDKKPRTKAKAIFTVDLEIGQKLTIAEQEALRRIWHELETGFQKKLRLAMKEVITEIVTKVPLCQAA